MDCGSRVPIWGEGALQREWRRLPPRSHQLSLTKREKPLLLIIKGWGWRIGHRRKIKEEVRCRREKDGGFEERGGSFLQLDYRFGYLHRVRDWWVRNRDRHNSNGDVWICWIKLAFWSGDCLGRKALWSWRRFHQMIIQCASIQVLKLIKWQPDRLRQFVQTVLLEIQFLFHRESCYWSYSHWQLYLS